MTVRSTMGLPGLAGAEHIGFTVPDIEQAVRFFVDIIGCVEVYRLDAISAPGSWMRDHLNVDQEAVARDVRLLRCGHGPNFEIFEYTSPDQSKTAPRNSDIGGHHIAFYVEDIDAAAAYLRTHGIVVLGEPTRRIAGPSGGQSWVYFLSPWGMQLELVSFPAGKAYEATSLHRLWHPARPAE